MISYQSALESLRSEGLKRWPQWATEKVSVYDCAGRYSARELFALDNNPRFNCSAMDGFALSSTDTTAASEQAPQQLSVVGCLQAGDLAAETECQSRSCVEIMTGARMPECGYDSVVRLEDVKIERDGERIVAISLVRPVQLGANVRYVGEDFKIGQRIVSPGTRLGPQHILGLATLGHHTIEVSVRPRVVVISTGDELVECSEAELGPSQIRNSTAPLLKSILEGYGAEVVACDVASDRREGVRAALERAIVACPDLVVTTGGVSVGKFDLVEDVLRELGAQIFFHKVAVRPGKPILFGELPTPGNVLVGSGQALICFGLPGNPIAVAAGARFFVLPFLRALLGGSLEVAHRLPILEQASKPGGLVFFQRGVRFGQGVKALNGQASFMTSSLMEAEGWIVSHSEGPVIAKGELVEWYPLWS